MNDLQIALWITHVTLKLENNEALVLEPGTT